MNVVSDEPKIQSTYDGRFGAHPLRPPLPRLTPLGAASARHWQFAV